MKITVKSAEKTWEKNDRRLYDVQTDQGMFKTFSDKIGEARSGESFDVEVYEKDSKHGKEKFVRQLKQEDHGSPAGRSGGGGFPIDPLRETMMLVSYAKDLETAMIAAGHIKEYSAERIVNTALDLRDLIKQKTSEEAPQAPASEPELDRDTLSNWLKEDGKLYDACKSAGWSKTKLIEVYTSKKCKGKKDFLEAVDSALADF